MPAQGLSQSELIRPSVMYLPVLRRSAPLTARGLPPPHGLLGPFGVVIPRCRSEPFCSDLVREYLAPIRLLAPHRPEFRSRLYPCLPSGWLQAGLCVSRCSPFRLRVSHYSSHTSPLDDTRPP